MSPLRLPRTTSQHHHVRVPVGLPAVPTALPRPGHDHPPGVTGQVRSWPPRDRLRPRPPPPGCEPGFGASSSDRTAPAAAGADPLAPLAPGVYTYIERDHALARVAPPPEAPAVQGGAGVRLVLTGNVDKLSKKYMSFGLRLAVQDCGCSLEVVRLVARCLGLPLRARARWDERELAAAIGADPRREPVVAVVHLGVSGDSQVLAGSEESGGRRAH